MYYFVLIVRADGADVEEGKVTQLLPVLCRAAGVADVRDAGFEPATSSISLELTLRGIQYTDCNEPVNTSHDRVLTRRV